MLRSPLNRLNSQRVKQRVSGRIHPDSLHHQDQSLHHQRVENQSLPHLHKTHANRRIVVIVLIINGFSLRIEHFVVVNVVMRIYGEDLDHEEYIESLLQRIYNLECELKNTTKGDDVGECPSCGPSWYYKGDDVCELVLLLEHDRDIINDVCECV